MLIRALRMRNSNTESVSDEPCCSRYLHGARQNDVSNTRASETASTSYLKEPRRQFTSTRASETASNSYVNEARRRHTSTRVSETERSRCDYIPESFSRNLDYIDRCVSETTCGKCMRGSETDSPAPPTPPVRLFRKKKMVEEKVSGE